MSRLLFGVGLRRCLPVLRARRAYSTTSLPFDDVKLPTLDDLYLNEGDNGEVTDVPIATNSSRCSNVRRCRLIPHSSGPARTPAQPLRRVHAELGPPALRIRGGRRGRAGSNKGNIVIRAHCLGYAEPLAVRVGARLGGRASRVRARRRPRTRYPPRRSVEGVLEQSVRTRRRGLGGGEYAEPRRVV